MKIRKLAENYKEILKKDNCWNEAEIIGEMKDWYILRSGKYYISVQKKDLSNENK